MRPDFNLIKNHALNAVERVMAHWLPHGQRQGHEWKATNPTRSDTTPDSFSINMNTGAWADFATGDKGGDLVALVAYLEGCKQGDAARRISDFLGLSPATPSTAHDKLTQAVSEPPSAPTAATQAAKAEWLPIMPVPDDAPAPLLVDRYKGEPSAAWAYFDASGRVLCHIRRFDTPTGKVILPLTYCQHQSGKRGWRSQALPAPRPLYNLHHLAQRPTAPVLVCEGEKAAEAAAALLPHYVTTTAPNGSKAPDKADWRPLAGRDVLLWPDNDASGYEYAQAVERLALASGATRVQWLQLDPLATLTAQPQTNTVVASKQCGVAA
jgi:putative DNA primase/helicase